MSKIKKNTKPNILLSSFPRSGNTWLRLLLTDVFLQIENLEVGQNALLSHIEKYVPDMHCDKLDNDCGSSSTNFIIVKTHSKYDNIKIKHEKVILLYREPEDCLISFYYHQQAKKKSWYKFLDKQRRFCE